MTKLHYLVTSLSVIYGPVCDVKNFQINYSFLIEPLFYITKKSGQNCKYLKNEKGFYHEIKSIFHHFERNVNCKKLSQTRKWTTKINGIVAFEFHSNL